MIPRLTLLTGLLLSLAWMGCGGPSRPPPEPPPEQRPIAGARPGFATADSCRSCHPGEHRSWAASYHRSMTRLATTDTVKADFNQVPLDYHGTAFTLSEEQGVFTARFKDPLPAERFAGDPLERDICLVTGSHHQQVFWFSTGQGRELARLPYTWLIADQRWVPHGAAFLHPPNLKGGFEIGRWNQTCIRCHATRGIPGIPPRAEDGSPTGPPDSQVVDFGIACEACHGGGERHVAAYREHQAGQAVEPVDPFIVHPESLSARRSSEICGQCHAVHMSRDAASLRRIHQAGRSYDPGEDLHATNTLSMVIQHLDPHPTAQRLAAADPMFWRSRFWSDGMVRVTGREYNGLLRTPCYTHEDDQRRMSCLSCHQMHPNAEDPESLAAWADDQLKPGMRGNKACLSCHEQFTAPEVLSAHTHHAPESSGSLCYDCHMPHTTFGLLKAVRSHTIDSPAMQDSLETGRPNACNLCHLDQTMAWTAKYLHEWYGQPLPELDDDQQQVAASTLWALQGDPGQRGVIAWNYGREEARQASGGAAGLVPGLSFLLVDDYDAVRYAAVHALGRLPGYEGLVFDYMAPPDQRRYYAGNVVRLWTAQEAWRDVRNPATLLLRSDGTIDQATVARLLEARDTRPLILEE